MRVFNEPNKSDDWKCPVCNTDDDGKIVLIGIVGTQEGHNMQAEQFHLDCLHLMYDKKHDIIFQRLES